MCPTCGSDRHAECCARCGTAVSAFRRGTGFCTARCARDQSAEDVASASIEENVARRYTLDLDRQDVETLQRVLTADVRIRIGEPRAYASSVERAASAMLLSRIAKLLGALTIGLVAACAGDVEVPPMPPDGFPQPPMCSELLYGDAGNVCAQLVCDFPAGAGYEPCICTTPDGELFCLGVWRDGGPPDDYLPDAEPRVTVCAGERGCECTLDGAPVACTPAQLAACPSEGCL